MTHTAEFDRWLIVNDPELENLGTFLAGDGDLKMFARECEGAAGRLQELQATPAPPRPPAPSPGPEKPTTKAFRMLVAAYIVGAILFGAFLVLAGLVLVSPFLFLWDWLKKR